MSPMRGGIRLLFLPLALSPLLPFAVFRANRIAQGEPRSLVETLGAGPAALAVAALVLGCGLVVVIEIRGRASPHIMTGD